MFFINVEYPTEQEEIDIMKLTTTMHTPQLKKVLNRKEILDLQNIVRKVPVADHVIEYALKLSRLSRPNNPLAPDFIKNWVAWGAGPRAGQYLILGAKARAVLQGRFYASEEDIRSVVHPVLRHRIICNFSAEAEGVIEVGVTSAYELSSEQQATISAAMAKRLGRKVEISNDIDESLIGGMVIRAGDSVIDASVKGRLKEMATHISS